MPPSKHQGPATYWLVWWADKGIEEAATKYRSRLFKSVLEACYHFRQENPLPTGVVRVLMVKDPAGQVHQETIVGSFTA